MKKNLRLPVWLNKIVLVFTILGPGLITASADNDAPGIATYSKVGSTYGYKFLWIIILITVGEVIIQEMAARMGTVTGKGAADLIRERFGVKITFFAMVCLFIANLGTTIAQFAGVAAAGELFGISRYISVPIAGLVFSLLVLRGNYKLVERILLILCLSSLSYIFTIFIIKPDWGVILHEAIRPNIIFKPDYIMMILAVIGTTITPWGIFYLQASIADRGKEIGKYNETRLDVIFGSVWGNIISAFIIIVTAATLYTVGISVEDAKDAAMALAPLAGEASNILFAVGLLGASLLAVSVLPLSTTYAVCEAFGFERGLNRQVKDAPVFYSLFGFISILSILFVMIPNMPLFQVMILSQSLNAILLPVLLILVLILANDRVILGKWTNSLLINIISIFLTLVIFLATLALLAEPILKLT